MALNIKDSETEQLAAEVAALTGETKTGAIRRVLRTERDRLAAQDHVERRRARFRRFLEEEIWPLIPEDQLGKPLTKEQEEEILGIGPDGA
jgi:antitoxin VapB